MCNLVSILGSLELFILELREGKRQTDEQTDRQTGAMRNAAS